MTTALNGNKTATINAKKLQFIQMLTATFMHRKQQKSKGDITQQHVNISATCWRLISPCMIFAVYDA